MEWDWKEAFRRLSETAASLGDPQRLEPLRCAIVDAVARGADSAEISLAVTALRDAESRGFADEVMRRAWVDLGPRNEEEKPIEALVEPPQDAVSDDGDAPVVVAYEPSTHMQPSLRMVTPPPVDVERRLNLPTSEWCRQAWEAAYSAGVHHHHVTRSRMEKSVAAAFSTTREYRLAMKFLGSGFRQGVWVSGGNTPPAVTYRLVSEPPMPLMTMLVGLESVIDGRHDRMFGLDDLRDQRPDLFTADTSNLLSWMAALGLVDRRRRGAYVLNVAPYSPWPWTPESTAAARRAVGRLRGVA